MYQTPWKVRDDRVSFLDLKNNKMAIPQDSDTVDHAAAGDRIADVGLSLRDHEAGRLADVYYIADKNNFGRASDLPTARSAGTATVVRGAWGVFYNFIPGFIGAHENIFNPPWRSGKGKDQIPEE